ncbi:Amidohydro-3 domain-containing protein [Mycena kentingensis (nom. inval.)]|nr:Amidohydro-3 domain-containing protein [Mycena kentingensis (nom. inval.)]
MTTTPSPRKTPGPSKLTALGIPIAVSLLGVRYALRTGSDLPQAATDYGSYYAICADAGNVYTVDATNTRADCLIVNGTRIVTTASLAETRSRSDLTVIQVPPGAIVLPGLSGTILYLAKLSQMPSKRTRVSTDSHGHVLEYGASRQLPLEGTASIDETVARVRDYILATPSLSNNTDAWIRGGGWDHTRWPGGAWPSAICACFLLPVDADHDLDTDPIIRGRPVVLQSKDCHALWVSARALELSQQNFPPDFQVDGGVILTRRDGSPSGVLLDNAQGLLAIPELTENDLIARFNVAMNDALAYGLTSVHDAGLDPASLAFFLRQIQRSELPIRIYGMRYFDETAPYWGNTSDPILGAANGRLTSRSVKIFADGALRTGGSALHHHYTDNPSTSGFMRLDETVLFDFIPQFLRDGWQVNVHAIGDRANGIVLDAFEESLRKTGVDVAKLRPRLEHAQLMTPKDMGRLGRLGGSLPAFSPHMPSVTCGTPKTGWQGPERVRNLYAFRSMLDAGARLTLGSDFPVETMNPLAGFYSAITRLSLDGRSPHGEAGWFPEERLTRTEALRGMTIDPAYASFTETELGSLEAGKRADFVVLSRDVMAVPVQDILGTKVLATVLDGRVAYGGLA